MSIKCSSYLNSPLAVTKEESTLCALRTDPKTKVERTRISLIKDIKHYADQALGEKCYVTVMNFYFSKLPPQLFEDAASMFYWKPNEKVPLADGVPNWT